MWPRWSVETHWRSWRLTEQHPSEMNRGSYSLHTAAPVQVGGTYQMRLRNHQRASARSSDNRACRKEALLPFMLTVPILLCGCGKEDSIADSAPAVRSSAKTKASLP